MKKNALFMAPMTTWSSNDDLTVSNEELKYYERRARNVDYVITGCTFTLRKQQGFANQFFAGSDDYLDSLGALAKAIHRGGAKAILQVQSPGRMVSPELQILPNIEIVSASAVRPERDGYQAPRQLTIPEIKTIVQSYYDVTNRAINAGFDGIEIHGANTFLPQQFVSPLTNLRSDEYGQDRLLFVRQLVEAVQNSKRDAHKPNFVIGYRFSPEEVEGGGLRLHHTFELLNYLCTTDIDYLHVSLDRYDRTSNFDNTIIAKALLKCIHQRKPLIGVGKIKTPQDVALAFDFGFDHVAIGTTLLLNPDWKTSEQLHLHIAEDTIPSDIPPRMRSKLLNMFA
jgi:2,4-dienoyl-CoA reductase-like NADH-dependent reductase (Old Yellow Enzyme family)